MGALTLSPVRRAAAVLPRTPRAPASARHWALPLLDAWQVPMSCPDDIEMDLSELVTNAVRYAAGPTITVSLRQHPEYLRVAVIDYHPTRLPVPAPDTLLGEGGRGLLLLDATSNRWGCRRYADRKSVWALWLLSPHATTPGGIS